MKCCEGGSAKGERPSLEGSMGELTAVASAKRAVRGDFNEGGLTDSEGAVVVMVGMESLEAERSRTENWTSFFC